jgi:hypothetical protein
MRQWMSLFNFFAEDKIFALLFFISFMMCGYSIYSLLNQPLLQINKKKIIPIVLLVCGIFLLIYIYQGYRIFSVFGNKPVVVGWVE